MTTESITLSHESLESTIAAFDPGELMVRGGLGAVEHFARLSRAGMPDSTAAVHAIEATKFRDPRNTRVYINRCLYDLGSFQI